MLRRCNVATVNQLIEVTELGVHIFVSRVVPSILPSLAVCNDFEADGDVNHTLAAVPLMRSCSSTIKYSTLGLCADISISPQHKMSKASIVQIFIQVLC